MNILKKTFILSILSKGISTLLLVSVWFIVNKYLTIENLSLFFLYMNVLTLYGLVELGISQIGVVWMASSITVMNKNSINKALINNIEVKLIYKNISEHFIQASKNLSIILISIGVIYFMLRPEIGLFNFLVYIIFSLLFCLHIINIPHSLLMEANGLTDIIQQYRIFDSIMSYGALIIVVITFKSLLCLPIFMFLKILFQRILIKNYPIKLIDFHNELDYEDVKSKKIFSKFIEQKKAMRITNLAGIIIFNSSIPYVNLLSDAKLSSLYSQTFFFYSDNIGLIFFVCYCVIILLLLLLLL
jgi:hypothetical protein